MTTKDVRKHARWLGIDPGQQGKGELIPMIQKAEGYEQCFGTATSGCPHTQCSFYGECVTSA